MIYRVMNVSHTYPGGAAVLSAVCLTVQKGDILTVLGPNGAGKSTLLACMAGMLMPAQGGIWLDGEPIARLTAKHIARIAAYVAQTQTSAPAYPVLHAVTMGRAAHIGLFQSPCDADRAIAMEALHTLSITHLADKPITALSGGERQLVAIARALAQQPKVLLLDEPAAHLDLARQERLLAILRTVSARGIAVILTTHNPDHALRLGGQAALLYPGGTVHIGPVHEMLTDEHLSHAYGLSLQVVEIPALGRKACLPALS